MGIAEISVASFYEKLCVAWKDNDGAAFAAFFTEDGSLINPFGERADGREALKAMYSEYFAGMLKGTTTSISSGHLRPVGPDHAFADADQTVYAANGDVLLGLHVVNLLRRDGDDWRLVDSRPYGFSPRPA
jgi:uncharacterized protein (TIGR02246 family)